MADSNLAVKAAPAGQEPVNDNDAQLLGEIAKLWTIHRKRGFDTRKDIGSLLNASLGDPEKPLPRGRSVLKRAAQKLRISASELNRMRWFAYFSGDEKFLWGDTSMGDRTWTLFKVRLPELIARHTGKELRKRSSGDVKPMAVLDGLLKTFSTATSKLNASNFTVDGPKREELIVRLQEFALMASNLCGVRFHVETELNNRHTTATSSCESSPTEQQCQAEQQHLNAAAA
jgi:hypothetical protein